LLIDAQKLQEKEQSKQVSELVSNYFTKESPDAKVFVSKIEIANGNPKVSKKNQIIILYSFVSLSPFLSS